MVLAFCVGLPIAWSGEVVLHRGRTLGMTAGGGNPITRVQEVFSIDEAVLAKQPVIDLRVVDPPIAIPDTVALTARRLKLERVVILKAELVNYQHDKAENSLKGVFFYVLEFYSPSGIINCVVLMDGTLITPRKVRIDGP
jgi:hypothetical protein